MNEVLSQDEIDKLLTAISSGCGDEDDFKPVSNSRKIKIYDFKRPDVFSREQLRTISNVHELFARAYTTFLAQSLKKTSHVHVASVDQLTFEEFIRAIPTPTACNIVTASIQGTEYPFITEFDPVVSFTMLGILNDDEELVKTSKAGKTTSNRNRGLTPQEMHNWEKDHIKPFLNILRKSMVMGFDSKIRSFSNKKTEDNPQFIDTLHPTDMVALVTLEVKIGNNEGMMNICLPNNLAHKLCNDYNGIPDPEPTKLDTDKFEDSVKVPIKVSLGTTSKSIKDIKGMGEGTIIELDKLAGEPVDVEFDGKIFAKGEVVVIDENFGVRLVEMV